jgi:hypothetical protein
MCVSSLFNKPVLLLLLLQVQFLALELLLSCSVCVLF